MTVSDMEIYESQRQSLEHLGLLGCSSICYEQLCDSFIIAVESAFSDATEETKGEKNARQTRLLSYQRQRNLSSGK